MGKITLWVIEEKSTTCIGKISNEPLTEYNSELITREANEYVLRTYGQDFSPYQCNTCNL